MLPVDEAKLTWHDLRFFRRQTLKTKKCFWFHEKSKIRFPNYQIKILWTDTFWSEKNVDKLLLQNGVDVTDFVVVINVVVVVVIVDSL